MSRAQGKVFGPNGKDITGGVKLNNEGFHNLTSSPNVVMVIKSRRMDEKCAKYWILQTQCLSKHLKKTKFRSVCVNDRMLLT
jgi:hypothetical protein